MESNNPPLSSYARATGIQESTQTSTARQAEQPPQQQHQDNDILLARLRQYQQAQPGRSNAHTQHHLGNNNELLQRQLLLSMQRQPSSLESPLLHDIHSSDRQRLLQGILEPVSDDPLRELIFDNLPGHGQQTQQQAQQTLQGLGSPVESNAFLRLRLLEAGIGGLSSTEELLRQLQQSRNDTTGDNTTNIQWDVLSRLQNQNASSALQRSSFPPANLSTLGTTDTRQKPDVPTAALRNIFQPNSHFLSPQSSLGGQIFQQSHLPASVATQLQPESSQSIELARLLSGITTTSTSSFAMAPTTEGATGHPPMIMSKPDDDENLSPFQCLVRQQIELFEAGPEEVATNARGRNKPVVLGQVGIRCRHCAGLPVRQRLKASLYYPQKLDRLYQASQSLANDHLMQVCQQIPEHIRAELKRLREEKATALSGKKYWGERARESGVYEDEAGLRFQLQHQPARR